MGHYQFSSEHEAGIGTIWLNPIQYNRIIQQPQGHPAVMLYRMMPSPVSDVKRGLDEKSPRILDTAHDPRARTVAQAVAEIQGVERVLLFGSRARGDHLPHSDIDLLVVVPADRKRPEAIEDVADRAVRRGYGN